MRLFHKELANVNWGEWILVPIAYMLVAIAYSIDRVSVLVAKSIGRYNDEERW